MRSRSIRTLAVLASVGLLVGAFAGGPAEAAKKKKKKKPASCAPATATGDAAEAEFVRLTQKATADAPVEIELDTAEGLGFSSSSPGGGTGHVSHAYQNLQVISKKPSATLFVAAEFAAYQDYDLYLRDAASQETLAYAAGFNQMPGYLDGGEGGHSDVGLEQIDAFAHMPCTGYTVDVVSAITEGGPVTLKLWLE